MRHPLKVALPATMAIVYGVLAPSTGAAQEATSKLSIHGYLTQGAARSDTLQMIGITPDGTTDYRRAALLMRYAASEKDGFVVQVAHRRLGNSPAMASEPSVKLDWAYMEHRFGEGTSIRVGRAPIPLGIFNETRYVGTLMPFYRAPYSVYFEGSFVSEAVDGIVLAHSLFAASPFRLDVNAYAGEYSLLEATQMRPTPTSPYKYVTGQSKVKGLVGTQLWLATPIDGLRVGAGAARNTTSGGVLRLPGQKQTSLSWHSAVDASFDRFTLRGENRSVQYEGNGIRYGAYYVQGGVRLAGGLWVNGQHELGKINYLSSSTGTRQERDYVRDDAAGVNYQFSPRLVLKVEGHQMKGYAFEVDGNYVGNPPMQGKYVITSLSTSF